MQQFDFTAVFGFALLAARKWPIERVLEVARMMVALSPMEAVLGRLQL
jgi:hypothetical protein